VYELAGADEVLQQLVAAPLQRCHYQPRHLHANTSSYHLLGDVAEPSTAARTTFLMHRFK